LTPIEGSLIPSSSRRCSYRWLIVVGTEDNAIGDPEPLAKLIPGARLVMLEGRDHMTAPADSGFKRAVLEFLSAAPR
jgi:hypothetical protein